MNRVATAGTIILCVSLALVANPSPEAHRQEIAQTYANENPVSGALGVGEALGTVASYHDYVLFSVTSLGEKRMSVGVAGIVHATPPSAAELSAFVMQNLPPSIRQDLLDELPDWMREKLQSTQE